MHWNDQLGQLLLSNVLIREGFGSPKVAGVPKLVREIERSLNRGGSKPLPALLLILRFCSS